MHPRPSHSRGPSHARWVPAHVACTLVTHTSPSRTQTPHAPTPIQHAHTPRAHLLAHPRLCTPTCHTHASPSDPPSRARSSPTQTRRARTPVGTPRVCTPVTPTHTPRDPRSHPSRIHTHCHLLPVAPRPSRARMPVACPLHPRTSRAQTRLARILPLVTTQTRRAHILLPEPTPAAGTSHSSHRSHARRSHLACTQTRHTDTCCPHTPITTHSRTRRPARQPLLPA